MPPFAHAVDAPLVPLAAPRELWTREHGMTRALRLAAWLLTACAAARAPEPHARPAASPLPAPAASVSAASPAVTATKREDVPTAPATPAPPRFVFSHVLDTPVSSLGVGTPPKLAVLAGAQVSVFDGRGWTALPLIPNAQNARFELFFGRDNEPRLMGSRTASDGSAHAFYKRFKARRWQDEPSELGPFASGDRPLFGLLGFTDPEVVCRAGEICLVKRVSGWSRVPAPAAPPLCMFLMGGTAWALDRGGMLRLEPAGFVRAETKFYPLPLAEPSALWGGAEDDVWLVGHDGAQHFDGSSWQRVAGVDGPLSAIAPVGRELWLAGPSGVYRGIGF
jgi:hypothetical protein